ncbi:hypothetical protein MKX01_034919, partial [Papaver californicum]
MASGQVVMRARYKNNGVKDPSVQEVLIMAEDKLDFSSDDPMPSARLNVRFRSIKGHKFSKEGRQKQTLLMLTQKPTIGSDKVLGKIQARQLPAPDTKLDSEKSATTLHDEQLHPEEMKLQMKLLVENSESQNLGG